MRNSQVLKEQLGQQFQDMASPFVHFVYPLTSGNWFQKYLQERPYFYQDSCLYDEDDFPEECCTCEKSSKSDKSDEPEEKKK